ncbi:DMT family transporter [Corynebacterium breve]|uniref:DMT family transporter n=1 Tax=Corynebacterium breve TaxID=3049799 RepID=A0ABY8VE24_9CORY|nr:DMT family transporter [Corynebacterium breve]WIM67914.1 DMT family transporter [Corynebacterium breve]
MQSNFVAVLIALASAFTIAWGTVTRHRIVAQPNADGDSPLLTGLRNVMWWISIGSAFVAYILQVVALAFGTLLVVQPILVLSLMFTLMLAAHVEKRRMTNSEVMWATILTIAVGILVMFGRPLPGEGAPDSTRWWIAVAVGATLGIVLTFFASRRSSGPKALTLGAVCGGVFGYVAVLSKAVADIFVAGGVRGIAQSHELYILIIVAILGTTVQQYAFAAGRLETSLPAMKVFELVVAFALGYLVLGEQFQVQTILGWSVMGLSLVAMFAATFALARKQTS